MASFTFCVSTDGAAFRDENNELDSTEVVKLLQRAANTVESGVTANQIYRMRDTNGNRVGYFVFQED